jgi:hypothetical protein
MPILYTGGKCILADTFQDAVESSKDADVIADLSRDKHVLSVTLTKLSEEIDVLHLKIAQLEKEKEDSIPKSCIKELIENAFKEGDIPIPILFKNMVDLKCDNITFSNQRGVCADVTFEDFTSSLVLLFTLVPIPIEPTDSNEIYPDFHMGYARSPRVKKMAKKKEGTVTSTKDSQPPTDNPS